MASGTNGTWSPPQLASMSFLADCEVAKDFLTSWFDISSTNDLESRIGSDKSAAFWIPDNLQTKTTESYFRSALPENVRDAATYGEILQWEFTLRQNASDSLAKLLDEVKGLPDTTLPDGKPLYFSIVVDGPARACQDKVSVCSLSFDPYRLSPINGPGMFVFYCVQCVIATFCALIILLGGLFISNQKGNPPKSARGLRKFFTIIFTAVKDRYDGLSVAAATFSLVLPAAIIVHFEVSHPKIFSYKDVLLELWVIVYSTTFSVWLYRMGACLRRQSSPANECPLCGAEDPAPLPSKRSSKPTLPAGIIILIALLGLIALTIFYAKVNMSKEKYQPFHFESFWDDVCEFHYRGTVNRLVVAGSVLLGYCALRIVSRFIPRWNDPSGRGCNTAGVLGYIDVVALGLMSWGFLYCYILYRYSLLKLTGRTGLFSDWTLGQVFAVSSLASLPLLFLMRACKSTPRHKTLPSAKF